ncbi:2Fe-2S iron-sulfur cluster-binding protein [Streptomyces antarcticus]|uniref:2Fe-2S iron-sulfur cluster-binding protein n=1 Tax=Streptomyces antarcticus TaxID=2996458 RepID=UPI00226E5CCD|nr:MULTISPECIES: 2Fe-2S iron-sulfur cluster-binding protein [unclassified Streptomyces]MCY0944608.1 2Fe-2S iron-sulfur cluster-binding protein [Streptomyces sp. H34-AA3]MCZ4087103.1 2Fe-2S iron-sulfur cluster-binding protein [Streptomyces sp. H34-S5]
MSGATGDPGNAGSASPEWGWEPVPHGGEYDSDATAFVKLPQDMLDALGTGEPLAAPGHGYVPPPMIVPLGSATTDPAATGTWTIPVQWPEAAGSAPAGPTPGTASGRVVGQGPAPVGGPIPASIPLPASVAAAFAPAEPGQRDGQREGQGEGHGQAQAYGQGQGQGQRETAEWGFPEAAHDAQAAGAVADSATGQWAMPGLSEQGEVSGQYDLSEVSGQYDLSGVSGQYDLSGVSGQYDRGEVSGQYDVGQASSGQYDLGQASGQYDLSEVSGQYDLGDVTGRSGDFRQGGLDADWSQAPATLPGGAPAPWANHPDFEDARGYAARQPSGEHGSGVLPGTDAAVAAAEAGRVPGGPGVGASRRGPRVLGGPGVGTPLPEGEPLSEGEPAHPAPHDIDAAHGPAATPDAGERPAPGGLDLFGGVRTEPEPEPAAPADGSPRPARYADTDGHGFAAFGHAPEQRHAPGQAHTSEPAPEPVSGTDAEPGPEPGAGLPAGAAPEAAAESDPDPDPDAGVDYGPAPDAGYGSAGAEDGGPAGERADTDGRGFAGTGPAPADTGAAHVPDADTADRAVTLRGEGTAGELPAEGPAYEDETGTAAVAHHEHPAASYVLRVNGADRPVTGAWIGESLLYVLRERLGLAGAKDGCSQGECGACAVQVDGRLVASCLVPAATAAGSEVRTVEGLATDGELSDVQQALCRSGAVQCGFCVPGMAMTIHDLLEGNHAPNELETRQALCGNLCRCSGYAGVVDAVREVVAGREAAAAEPSAGAPGAAGSGVQAGSGVRGGTGAQTGTEPRIPHQAPPGEGGIHHGGTE